MAVGRKIRKRNTMSMGEVWSEIDHRFIKDSQGRLKRVENIQAVYTSIDCILRTNKGERVMLSQFGINRKGIIFSPLTQTSVSYKTRELKEQIEAWDDRVVITEISISRDPDHNAVDIRLTFAIQGYEDVFNYNTTIQHETE